MKLIPSNHAASFGQTHATASSLADALLLAKLGHDLRTLYTDFVDEPVPEALNRLVARLDALDDAGRDGA
ncbi:NepR family anti-sigma factor [Methylobacterium sp. ID0610]|uniref:NepR family anti-sigma factor n=1 Tax=Methylobacterium carpenticola TaxID=3344827 RepID=UPI0036999880